LPSLDPGWTSIKLLLCRTILGVCRNTRDLESAATQAHDLAGGGAAVTPWTCSVGLMIEDAWGCPGPLSGQGSPVPV